jgi:hypothetical protein
MDGLSLAIELVKIGVDNVRAYMAGQSVDYESIAANVRALLDNPPRKARNISPDEMRAAFERGLESADSDDE